MLLKPIYMTLVNISKNMIKLKLLNFLIILIFLTTIAIT